MYVQKLPKNNCVLRIDCDAFTINWSFSFLPGKKNLNGYENVIHRVCTNEQNIMYIKLVKNETHACKTFH